MQISVTVVRGIRQMHSKQTGVTLIELMIVVAIVAILAAIAYPSYRNQIMRSHRAEAKAALLQVQVAQEKWFLHANQYGTLIDLGLSTGANYLTPNGYYQISFSSQTANAFTAQAVPQGGQAPDTCGTYTISATGNRTPTTSGCW